MVDEYLANDSFVRLEHLLRSTKSCEPSRHDPELNKLVDAFDTKEEERLERNLTSVAYEVDTVETLALVTGPGRIERVGSLQHDWGIITNDGPSISSP